MGSWVNLGRPTAPDDTRLVLDAAAALEVQEYDLFVLAYRWWFGQEAPRQSLERTFVAYMFHHVVPPWVRQFAREVLSRADSGGRGLAPLQVAQVREPAQPPRHGWLYVAATGVAFVFFYIWLLNVPYHPETSEPIWPETTRGGALGCGGSGPGLRFFEELAHALAGREMPRCQAP